MCPGHEDKLRSILKLTKVCFIKLLCSHCSPHDSCPRSVRYVLHVYLCLSCVKAEAVVCLERTGAVVSVVYSVAGL